MRLAIIAINYNSSENTISLLESLKNQTDPAQSSSADHQQKGQTLSGASKDFEVIVVDNNSDDVGKLMDYQTPETNIIYIKNDRNLGFSGGNNVGIKKALKNGANWVLLLNNDTWVESTFIEHLKTDLKGREGVVGLALDEGNRTVFAGLTEWLKPTLSNITYLTTRRVVSPHDTSCRYYAIGGAVVIHKNVFDKIGFLDENYFLYFEDADFCQKARKAGIPVSFLPEIKIYHSVSASTKKLGSPMLLRYHYRNALYFNLKNGPWYIKLFVWPWSWFVAAKQIIKIAVGINREQSKAILTGVMDFYRKKMGIIKVPPVRDKKS